MAITEAGGVARESASLDAPLGLNDYDDRLLGDTLESDAVSPEADALSRERSRRIEAGLDDSKAGRTTDVKDVRAHFGLPE